MYGTAKLLQIFLIGYNSLACMHVWRMYDSLLKPDSPIQKITDFSGSLFAFPEKYYYDYPIIYGNVSTTNIVWIDTSLDVISTDHSVLILYNIYKRLFPIILLSNILIIIMGVYRYILDILEEKDD